MWCMSNSCMMVVPSEHDPFVPHRVTLTTDWSRSQQQHKTAVKIPSLRIQYLLIQSWWVCVCVVRCVDLSVYARPFFSSFFFFPLLFYCHWLFPMALILLLSNQKNLSSLTGQFNLTNIRLINLKTCKRTAKHLRLQTRRQVTLHKNL